jgi:RNA polymerase sigma factor (sigma-70 family)
MYILKNQPDEVLFTEVQNKNEQAIAVLLDRYKKQFYSYILVIVKDHYIAEDLFQEACIKIIQSIRLGKYKEDGRFVQWASRIVRNLCMDHLKSSKKRTMVSMPDGSDVFAFLNLNVPAADHRIIETQFVNRLHMMLEQLPNEQREIIIMRFFYKLSFKEIAHMLDTNVNTAMGRMRYGLIRLRNLMGAMKEAV